MRKFVFGAALLLVSAMTGTSTASSFDLGAISTAGAVTAAPEGHSFGEDGMVWTPGVASADCLAATPAGWCSSSEPDRPSEDLIRRLVAAFGPSWENAIRSISGFALPTGEWFTASTPAETTGGFGPLLGTAALEAALALQFDVPRLLDGAIGPQVSAPEPMSFLLVGAGLAGLRSLRRRR